MRIIKDENGSILEFLLTIPILLAIILLGITFIMASYSKIAINITAREVARNYAITAHEYTESERTDKAKEVGVKEFNAILPMKNAQIEEDDIIVSRDTPVAGYVMSEVTARVPMIAPGMSKVLGFVINTDKITVDGGEIDAIKIKGSAVFKEEINLNT